MPIVQSFHSGHNYVMKNTRTGHTERKHTEGPILALFVVFLMVSTSCRLVTGSPAPTPRPATALPQHTAAFSQTPAANTTPTLHDRLRTPTFESAQSGTTSSQTPQPAQPTLPPTTPVTITPGTREGEFPTLTCQVSPITDGLIQNMTAETWLDWVEKLSGAEPVVIGGEETIITTRYSPSMFSGQPNARAFDFVLEQVKGWYSADQVEVMDFTVTRQETEEEFTWQNLILTLPGVEKPEEVVILSAHLDSVSNRNPDQTAPGAEDNGSGSASLLEAARLFQNVRFQRTVQIIWFTGEEQGLLGSKRFVEALDASHGIIGVINLDMFGYDSDNDRCFELHVGRLPQSDAIGRCFVQSIDAYQLDLPQYDYLTQGAIAASDHGSFWDAGIGAVQVLENMFDQDQPNGCSNSDMTPHYHTPQDTADRLNPESAVEIARAALATAMSLAELVEP